MSCATSPSILPAGTQPTSPHLGEQPTSSSGAGEQACRMWLCGVGCGNCVIKVGCTASMAFYILCTNLSSGNSPESLSR